MIKFPLPVRSKKGVMSGLTICDKKENTFMEDCKPWLVINSYFDKEQKKINKEFKKMNYSSVGGLHG